MGGYYDLRGFCYTPPARMSIDHLGIKIVCASMRSASVTLGWALRAGGAARGERGEHRPAVMKKVSTSELGNRGEKAHFSKSARSGAPHFLLSQRLATRVILTRRRWGATRLDAPHPESACACRRRNVHFYMDDKMEPGHGEKAVRSTP